MKKLFAMFIALLMIPGMSLAEVRLEGQVAPGQVYTLLAPADGRIASVPCAPGERCAAGGEAVLFLETVVCAPQDGTVTYVPARAGESSEMLEARYGGAVLLNPSELGTVSGSVRKGYTGTVASGQTVLLKSASGGGEGRGTLVRSGTDRVTVHVTEGSFTEGEKVNLFAAQPLDTASQIGTGSFSASPECGISGTGYVAGVFVKAGDEVKLGDPLFRTLPFPTRDAPVFLGSGVVLEVFVKAGDQVSAGQPLLSYCLTDELVIEAEAAEYALPCLTEGTAYAALLPALNMEGAATLQSIGACPLDNAEDTAYPAIFLPEAMGEALRIGMTAYIVIPGETP